MDTIVFASAALGIAIGLLSGLFVTKKLAAHHPRISKIGPVVGGALATLPAVFLSIVVGGMGGGGFGEEIAGQAGIPFGLAAGIATVLGVGISFGAMAGAAMGWFVVRMRRAIN